MKRSKRSTPTERIALFPFLAVLICTMGALLVLLVIMSQHAQAKATQERAQKTSEAEADADRTLEDLQMWIEQWKGMRANTEEDLADRRTKLSHIENHMRQLRARLDEIKAARTELAKNGIGETSQLDKLRQEQQRVRAELAAAKQQLEELKQQAVKQVSYAIIPYKGPHETLRRPIYIECRQDAVILQPEGIRLDERDFVPPLGPANPLVSAIRAASAHWQGLAAAGQDVGRPYPLLLVRPDGIEAYYAARSAMKRWETDFGYELVGDDWDLSFTPPDARLAASAQQAVEAARRRRAGRGGGGLGGLGGRREGYRSGQAHRLARGLGTRDGEFAEAEEGDLSHGFGRKKPAKTQSETSATSTASGVPSAPPSAEGAQEAEGANVESIAETRGKDWASPAASKGLIPMTRTMSIQIAADRLLIYPQDPSGLPSTVMMPDSTSDGVEEFVSEVWEEMKSWGSAGRGMYWRPEINLQVLPGGERRAYELQILLKDSGLDLAPPTR